MSRDEQDGGGASEKKELGKVGQIIATVVALAILVPFIGILWAWAADVIKSFGGY